MNNNLLLIVDPQIDFICGSLPVPGASEAMEALATYIDNNSGLYSAILITVDWHPWSHSSFTDNGGIWPRHCVAYSKGAAITECIISSVCSTDAKVAILTKGTEIDTEEYSVFGNRKSSEVLKHIVEEMSIDHIDICGLAGDVCVKTTAADAAIIYGVERISVLEQFSPKINPDR